MLDWVTLFEPAASLHPGYKLSNLSMSMGWRGTGTNARLKVTQQLASEFNPRAKNSNTYTYPPWILPDLVFPKHKSFYAQFLSSIIQGYRFNFQALQRLNKIVMIMANGFN